MQRFVEFMLATPIKTFEMWLSFVRFKVIVSDEEMKNENVRATFLFLASMKGITKDTILAVDPTQELRLLMTELFEKIVAKWKNISADYLLPVAMNLLPELDEEQLNLLVKQLAIIYDVIYFQYGANSDLYSVITLLNAIKIKQDKIAWRNEKASAKEIENEEKVIHIVKEIHAEQQKSKELKLEELKSSSPKSLELGSSGPLLFSSSLIEEIKDHSIVCNECHLIYLKVHNNPHFLNFIEELCVRYKQELEKLIRSEVQKKDSFNNKYFKGKNAEIGCRDILNDVNQNETEIATFVRMLPALHKNIIDYRLTCAVINTASKKQEIPRTRRLNRIRTFLGR